MVLRRAYRILVDDDDPRPLGQRLTREAKRILAIALTTLVVLVAALIVAAIVVVSLLT